MTSLVTTLSGFTPRVQSFPKFVKGSLPRFVIGSDLDHSIIPWKEDEYRREVDLGLLNGNQFAFKQVQSPALFVVLTGIDHESAKEISGELNGFPPIDILATDNGLELRVNDSGEPSKTWLAKDKNVDPNSDWEAFLQTSVKWDRVLFSEAMFRVLNNFGLHEVKEDTSRPEIAYSHHTVFKTYELPVRAVFSSGESAIYLLKEGGLPPEFIQQFGNDIAKSIVAKYNKINPESKISYKLSEHDKYFYIFFSPDNGIKIDKASAFESSLKFPDHNLRNALQYAIVIGDSENDTHSKLREVAISGEFARIIPVYSIISGKHSRLLDDKEVSTHPRLIIAEEMGNIGDAFELAVQRGDMEAGHTC